MLHVSIFVELVRARPALAMWIAVLAQAALWTFVPTFAYSDSVKNAHVTWDATSLDKWLADPDAFIPDSNMAFRVVNADERSSIIAYLKQIQAR